MASVQEIKFFMQGKDLFVALFDNPPPGCDEWWIKNVRAAELGFTQLPENVQLEIKYKVEDLGIEPFNTTKPEFELMGSLADLAWNIGTKLAIGAIFP